MLTLFPDKFTPARLPAGSFTVDRRGEVVVTTLPSNYPRPKLAAVGRHILQLFQSARKVQLPLAELVVNYASMTVVAKELRGGAIVYLKPVSLN